MTVKYNSEIAEEYMKVFTAMQQQFSIDNDIRVSGLARFPEVLTMEEKETEEEELWPLMEEAFRGACEKFTETRIAEGEKLKEDLIKKLDTMLTWVCEIEERSPQIIQEYRSKIEERVKELLENTQIDEGRIAAEVTLFADKICVDEEIVRLRSHMQAMKDTLNKGGAIGRKLDFIAQEMNREANTILSKSNDISITNHGIELKTEIEKVREQIQNIE